MKGQLKILVTGGAGYLGSILVPALLREGHKVTVLDSFIFKQSSLLDCCANPDFDMVRGDVRDERLVGELVKDKDLVIPLAALVGAPLCDRDPLAATSVNRDAIGMLCGKLSHSQRVIYPTTNSGYGIGTKGKFCTEETPLNPISLYGRVKSDAEAIVLSRNESVAFRLATVFGASPRMRLDLLVNDFTYRAVKDRFIVIFEGHFKRNYVHVRDVARAFIHTIENFDKMKGETYNVGLSEANLSKLQLCDEIKKQIPQFVVMEAPCGEDPDKRDYIVSNEKIEKTGYKTVHSLQAGITELIKTYRILKGLEYANI